MRRIPHAGTGPPTEYENEIPGEIFPVINNSNDNGVTK